MNPALTRTTTALLDDLIAQDQDAWAALDARYRPVLFGFARRMGLDAVDAADAAQEALARFATAYRDGRYQRDRGRLGSWLLGIARNCIRDVRAASLRAAAPALPPDLEDDASAHAAWTAERDRDLLARALDALQRESSFDERTIHIFDLLSVHGIAPAVVAEQTGTTTNDVYLAKHRCLKRLREIIARLTEAFETDA